MWKERKSLELCVIMWPSEEHTFQSRKKKLKFALSPHLSGHPSPVFFPFNSRRYLITRTRPSPCPLSASPFISPSFTLPCFLTSHCVSGPLSPWELAWNGWRSYDPAGFSWNFVISFFFPSISFIFPTNLSVYPSVPHAEYKCPAIGVWILWFSTCQATYVPVFPPCRLASALGGKCSADPFVFAPRKSHPALLGWKWGGRSLRTTELRSNWKNCRRLWLWKSLKNASLGASGSGLRSAKAIFHCHCRSLRVA